MIIGARGWGLGARDSGLGARSRKEPPETPPRVRGSREFSASQNPRAIRRRDRSRESPDPAPVPRRVRSAPPGLGETAPSPSAPFESSPDWRYLPTARNQVPTQSTA